MNVDIPNIAKNNKNIERISSKFGSIVFGISGFEVELVRAHEPAVLAAHL